MVPDTTTTTALRAPHHRTVGVVVVGAKVAPTAPLVTSTAEAAKDMTTMAIMAVGAVVTERPAVDHRPVATVAQGGESNRSAG
jgi:hypothetical protein